MLSVIVSFLAEQVKRELQEITSINFHGDKLALFLLRKRENAVKKKSSQNFCQFQKVNQSGTLICANVSIGYILLVWPLKVFGIFYIPIYLQKVYLPIEVTSFFSYSNNKRVTIEIWFYFCWKCLPQLSI